MSITTSLRSLVEGIESLIYIEDVSRKRGFLQSLNPMVKLAVTLFMIISSLFVSSLIYLILICVVPIILSITSKIPMKDFLVRTTLIPFFAILISFPILFITQGTPVINANLSFFNITLTYEGIQHFALFTIRVWFCIASLSLFILSTGFNVFLNLLYSIKIPSILIQMFSLTYRYLFLSIHEIQRILIAKEARTYFLRRTINMQSLKHSGLILATIFIRTYERSERVYMAMKSRGFEIENKSQTSISKFHIKDIIFIISTISVLSLILIL
jgi:cobalt/nickel transport system permease protein